MIPIEEFASRLASIPDQQFTDQAVLDYIRKNRVDVRSLAPYLYFSGERYTRNLIHQTSLFELIAICWETGQKSAIHNHRDQRCWMAVAYGKVQVHNFKLISKNPATGFCELEPSTHFVIDLDNPQGVDPAEPIHQVVNAHSFNSRAVTLHVYSRPFDTCEIYDMKARHYADVNLANTTEYGVVVKTDIKLEKVMLPPAPAIA
jgi:predicted metal-dependent enzyme (double-stranded beta helix superfamily)